MRRTVSILLFAVALLGSVPALALKFERVPLDDGYVLIAASGTIVNGDTTRLANFMELMPSNDRLLALTLNSLGGSLLEAEKLSGMIHRMKMPVAVVNDASCASACFLLFAAGSTRFVSANSLVGVHSASQSGEETMGSMAMTTAMARDAKAFGVPPGIIGRMVTTQPGDIAWLTVAELRGMGTIFLEQVASSSDRSVAQSPRERVSGYSAVAPLPLNIPTQPPTAISPAFQQGAADRRAWEEWFASLTGDYRDGAFWWSGERSKSKPGTCFAPDGQSLGNWTSGCIVAQQRLTPTDKRRRAEPEYRAGWNSL